MTRKLNLPLIIYSFLVFLEKLIFKLDFREKTCVSSTFFLKEVLQMSCGGWLKLLLKAVKTVLLQMIGFFKTSTVYA